VNGKELETMVQQGKGSLTLGSVLAGREVPFLCPDHGLEMALRYADRWPIVPVAPTSAS
jgi:hypothetical protein